MRSTYRGYDAVDEVEAAYSICIDPTGSRIYAGYKKSIKIFDIDRPGRDCKIAHTNSPSSAICIDDSQTSLATGSWNKNISLFDIRSTFEAPHKILCGTHRGGITYLKFLNENYLVSGARKDSSLIFWDLRYTSTPYFIFNREVNTNQRIYFDITRDNKWLMTGNTNGILRVWNLFEACADSTGSIKESSYKLYNACLNGVSAHPHYPIIATTSGQHAFEKNVDNFENSCIAQNFITMWWVDGK